MKDAPEATIRHSDFESFYDLHADALYRSVIFRVRDNEIAGDIIQEACVRVWQHWDRYESDDHRVRALYVITRNLLMDHYRKTGRISNTEPEANSPAPAAEQPDEQFHEKHSAAQLHKLLGQLSEIDRDVVVARSLEDTPYAEIARLHDKTEPAIRKIHSRALQKLTQLMRTHYGINYRPY